MLYDGICVRMFICGYYRMWLHLHVYIDCMIYIYIYLWVLAWLKMGESRMQDEHVSKSLWQFMHMLICAHFYVYQHIKEGQKLWSLWEPNPSHQHIHSLLVPTTYDTSTTMAFYIVNMHHCDIKFPQQTWSHECMQMPRTLASCQPTAAAQHYRMHGC